MSTYLTKFENNAAYSAAESGLILPNVSYCVSENEVHYKPYIDPSGGHAFVEIGGIKWATMNIGAESITDYGLYFQWGDTQGYTADQVGTGSGQKYFGWKDYKYGNGTSSPGTAGMTKYNSTDGKAVLDLEDDAVNAAWGGNWRMPTTAEFQALGTAVNTAWTTDYQSTGVKGLVCTSKADGATLFFPAVGYAGDGGVGNAGNYSYYWSSSLNTYNASNAYLLYFNGGADKFWKYFTDRYSGFSVRGVLGA